MIGIFIFFILFSFSFSINAMDPVTEDSWIGAYFLKQNLLTKEQKVKPFLSIRQSNRNQNDLSSNFKWIIANGILADNLKTYKLMKERNIAFNELYKLEHLIENYNDNSKRLKIELAIMDKLQNEIVKSFENNIKDKNKESFYNFYHIFLYKTQYFTVPEIDEDSKDKSFKKDFKVSKNELKESKINTKYFNDLTPLKPKEVLEFGDSPLVTINSYNISEKDKEKAKKELSNAEFKYKYRVNIRKFPLTYQNIEDLYLELLKLDKDSSNLLKKVRKSKYYDMSINQLFKKIEEVKK